MRSPSANAGTPSRPMKRSGRSPGRWHASLLRLGRSAVVARLGGRSACGAGWRATGRPRGRPLIDGVRRPCGPLGWIAGAWLVTIGEVGARWTMVWKQQEGARTSARKTTAWATFPAMRERWVGPRWRAPLKGRRLFRPSIRGGACLRRDLRGRLGLLEVAQGCPEWTYGDHGAPRARCQQRDGAKSQAAPHLIDGGPIECKGCSASTLGKSRIPLRVAKHQAIAGSRGILMRNLFTR